MAGWGAGREGSGDRMILEQGEPIATFMYRGSVVVVTLYGYIMMWKMHPVTGEYNWYNIGRVKDPFE
jgi:hypothetical protein